MAIATYNETDLLTKAPSGAPKRWRSFIREALRHPGFVVSSIVLIFIIGACFLGPLLVNIPGPNIGSLADPRLPLFSPGYLLGTNALGDSLLSQSLYGGRISIEVGFGATALGLVVGTIIGVFAGYRQGWLDTTLMRVIDVFLAFPSLVLALAISAYLGPNERDELIAISFFTMPSFARLARAETVRIMGHNFIIVSIVSGASQVNVIWRHVLRNIVGHLITYGMVTVGVAITIEAGLSFLGLGVRPPQPSWGNMIAAGESTINNDPTIILVPSVFLFVTVMCTNLIGNYLRKNLE